MLRLLLLISLLAPLNQLQAQHSWRFASVPCPVQWVQLDSLPIVSGSIAVRHSSGRLLSAEQFYLLPGTGRVRFSEPFPAGDTLFCSWRSIQAPLSRHFQFLNERIRQPELRPDEFRLPSETDPGSFGALRRETGPRVSGVMFRGLSTGNNQDLVPSSGLNLQISGFLAPGIGIEAAMTEQEVPFQPEGTSSQLQDFDRIYLSIKHEGQNLTLGDFPLQDDGGSYFLRYRKKARGVLVSQSKQGSENQIRAAAALSRGRFARNQIQGQERNQGPYRLTGAFGESPVIVVSGSEVVYLNGQKMERGLDKDYVADYNLGEITFNPNRIITAFSRIVVEFQYSDRNYARSVSAGSVAWKQGRHVLQAGLFSESDLKNQPLQQNLELFDSSRNLDARGVLAEAGNDPANAVISGIRKLSAFDPAGVNYTLKDSNGATILVYAPVMQSGVSYYRASFSYLGPGRGNYVAEASAGNGRVYRWVQPQGGIPAGQYEPIIRLAMPKRNTMLHVAQKSDWIQIGARSRWRSELALASSGNDRNTFSAVGDSSNKGSAGMLQLQGEHLLSRRDSALTLTLSLRHERIGRTFNAIERFRDVEFERLWNRGLNNPEYRRPDAAENLWQGNIGFRGRKGLLFQNKLEAYQYTGFSARRRESNLHWYPGNWLLEAENGQLKGNISGSETQNSNSKVHAGYRKGRLQSGINWEQESNTLRNDTGLMQAERSFKFHDLGAYYRLDAQGGWQFSAGLGQRLDYGIRQNTFQQAYLGGSGSLNLKHQNEDGQFWSAQIYRRNLNILDSNLMRPDATGGGQWMLRSEWLQESSWYRINGFIQSASGREQRRQFVFFEVPAGQGTHSWIDYNENQIQEQNEFVPAVFRDQARYIQLLLPTPEFVEARSNDYTLNAEFRFPEIKKKYSFLQRFSSSHSLIFNGRNSSDRWLLSILPESLYGGGTAGRYFSGRSLERHSLFFNRNEGNLSLEYTFQRNEQKSLVSNGTDSRRQTRHISTLRFTGKGPWMWNQYLELGMVGSFSAFYSANTYSYDYQSVEEKITFNGSRNFRVSLNGKFAPFLFRDAPAVSGYLLDAGTEWQMGLWGNSNLETTFTYSRVQFPGNTSSPAAFDVMRGLQPGDNLRWNLNLRMKTGNHIQVDLGYEGRSIPSFKTIHNGRVEARYLF